MNTTVTYEPATLVEIAEHISAGRFYVEARIGSANYRNGRDGHHARLLLDGGGVNTTPDAVLANIARAFLSQRAELARLRAANAEMAAALEPFTELDRNIGGEWGAECERLRAALARHAATNAGEDLEVKEMG